MTARDDAARSPALPWTVRLLSALLLALHAALCWCTSLSGLGVGGDDAQYFSLARALRSGSYADLPIDGTPLHSMYPPLYPAWLALLNATSPDRVPLAVGANIALSVFALALAARLAGRMAPWLSIALLLLLAPNPLLIFQASTVSSEPLAMALAMLTCGLLVPASNHAPHRVRGAIAAIATALARTVGVTMVAAVVMDFALARRWRAVSLTVVGASLTVGAWLLWTVEAPRLGFGSSYVADAMYVPTAAASPLAATARDTDRVNATSPTGDVRAPTPSATSTRAASPVQGQPLWRVLGHRVIVNIPNYIGREWPWAMSVPVTKSTVLDNIAWLLVTLVFGGVGAALLMTRMRIVVLFIAFYFALLAVWPYELTRYLAPVLPALVLVVVAGAWHVGAQRAGRARHIVWICGLGVAIVAVSGPAQADARQVARVLRCGRDVPMAETRCLSDEQRDFLHAVDALQHQPLDSARVLTSKESTVYQLTGRRSMRQSEATAISDSDGLLRAMRQHHVGYVIVSRVHIAQWALADPLVAHCGEFRLLARFGPHAALLRFPGANETPSLADSSACTALRAWAEGDWIQDEARDFEKANP